MSEENKFNTELEIGNYLMLTPKSRHGKTIVSRLGEYWIIEDMAEIEEVDSFVLARCVIEQDFRGGPERLVIDSANGITVYIEDDNNFDFEQVIYEAE